MNTETFKEATTYAEVLSWASSFLKQNKRDPNIAKWLLQERFGLTLTDFVSCQNKIMPKQARDRYIKDIKEAGKGRPPQQIVGHEWFYERKFMITNATLIPRPETEEWFHRYVKNLPERPLRVLDIGTGSGVLAVSHKLERPQDEVIAVDISQTALDVAKMNAHRLNADVTFHLSNMMSDVSGEFDLILSNPPYISQSEKSVMDESVIDFEPHIALFAQEDGLFFYKKIAEQSVERLRPEGCMILEIGYRQGRRLKEMLQTYFPEADIAIRTDFNNNDRTLHVNKG
ncbi:peptide chain release factor N(5)-glutamine methyltransferase [Alkalibacterium kapii]|uniref:peptide chain release factor N(5)-glutamine methyltransferase n=1 Tax=Alkalibacterium kapii TaxID=426704 RepID=A0A511AQF4_9LACT|nr:peptide chain release factor N(5)-glutamine methyltransferase [Alkalibacterium kapii]GEK90408.1 release factor glutamine methyltransferase [Alkalibacterium kapii]